MTITVEITGLKETLASLKEFKAELVKGLGDIVNATAIEALSDVRSAIQNSPATGRVYMKGKNKDIVHRASAPGEPPATDTGGLLTSTYLERPDPLTAIIGSSYKHSLALEFGTRDGKLAKRPAWIPAAERAAPKMQKRVQRLIAELSKKAAK